MVSDVLEERALRMIRKIVQPMEIAFPKSPRLEVLP